MVAYHTNDMMKLNMHTYSHSHVAITIKCITLVNIGGGIGALGHLPLQIMSCSHRNLVFTIEMCLAMLLVPPAHF